MSPETYPGWGRIPPGFRACRRTSPAPFPSPARFHAIKIDRPLVHALAISLIAHGLALAPGLSPPTTTSRGTLRAHLPPPAVLPATAPLANDTVVTTEPTSPQPIERSYRQTTADPGVQEDLPLQANGPGVDGAGLRQYHFALSRVAANFRSYPPQARDAGWGGRVTIRLTVAEGGVPQRLRLLTSSGHNTLDQAALEMLRLAASHTPIPDALLGQRFEIDLAIDYDPTNPPPPADRLENHIDAGPVKAR